MQGELWGRTQQCMLSEITNVSHCWCWRYRILVSGVIWVVKRSPLTSEYFLPSLAVPGNRDFFLLLLFCLFKTLTISVMVHVYVERGNWSCGNQMAVWDRFLFYNVLFSPPLIGTCGNWNGGFVDGSWEDWAGGSMLNWRHKHWIGQKFSILVSWSSCKKKNAIDWVAYKQQKLISMVLKEVSPSSGYWHDWVLVRVLFWAADCSLCLVCGMQREEAGFLMTITRALIPFMGAPPSRPLLILVC